jgi:hypothetical protein
MTICESCSRAHKARVAHDPIIAAQILALALTKQPHAVFPSACAIVEAFLALTEHWQPTTCKTPQQHAPGCDCGNL